MIETKLHVLMIGFGVLLASAVTVLSALVYFGA